MSNVASRSSKPKSKNEKIKEGFKKFGEGVTKFFKGVGETAKKIVDVGISKIEDPIGIKKFLPLIYITGIGFIAFILLNPKETASITQSGITGVTSIVSKVPAPQLKAAQLVSNVL